MKWYKWIEEALPEIIVGVWEDLCAIFSPVWEEIEYIFKIYRTSIVIPISILFSLYMIVYNNNPPSFPLIEENINPIDCYNIKSAKVSLNKSRIMVELRVGDFIEYPKEVAPSLINIVATSGGVTVDYNSSQYWDLESDGENYSFCALHTIGGKIDISLYCYKQLMASTSGEINDIDVFPVGWSWYKEINSGIGIFNDVCLMNNRLYYFSKPETKFKSLRTTKNYEIPISVDSLSISEFMSKYQIRTFYKSAYVLTSDVKNPIDVFTDVVLPFSSIYHNAISTELVFLRNQTYLHQYFNSWMNIKIIENNGNKLCFEHLIIPRSEGSLSPTNQHDNIDVISLQAVHYESLLSISIDKINYVKNSFEQSKQDKHVVFMDEKSNELTRRIINEEYPLSKIILLDETKPLNETTKDVSSSGIFMVSNIRNFLLSIFLDPQSNVIQIIPDGICSNSEDNLLRRMKMTQYKLKGSDCKCNNTRCYFQDPLTYNSFNENEFRRVFREIHR